ncbi:hypothetical protein V8E51_002881 [Hyaloscypha variabilis]
MVISEINPTRSIMATWTTKSGVLWLNDTNLLPKVTQNSRVLTFGYNANAMSSMGITSSDRILQHAQTLVAQPEANRSALIFICHSLGGIVVKRALAYSASRTGRNVTHIHSIYVSTFAVLFLGTPHNGSSKAQLAGIDRQMLDTMVPSRAWDTDGQLVDALREGSGRFHIYFFWEQEKTDFGTTKGYVVDKSSAAPILDNTERSGIPASRSGMCKLESSSETGYITAPGVIQIRWNETDRMLSIERSNEAVELTRDNIM